MKAEGGTTKGDGEAVLDQASAARGRTLTGGGVKKNWTGRTDTDTKIAEMTFVGGHEALQIIPDVTGRVREGLVRPGGIEVDSMTGRGLLMRHPRREGTSNMEYRMPTTQPRQLKEGVFCSVSGSGGSVCGLEPSCTFIVHTNTHSSIIASIRSERAEETRRHLERAAQRKEEEQRAAAEQARERRSQYKAGRLTDEERAARLAAMSSAADDHDQERLARVRSHVVREAAEERETAGRRAGTTAAFLETAQKGAFGAGGTNGTTLQEAVNRRKHFNQRGNAAGGAAFRR